MTLQRRAPGDPSAQATITLQAVRTSPRIDHVALRVTGLDEWTALLGRLNAHRIDHQLSALSDDIDTQLWVTLAPGLTIEIINAY